VVSEMVERVARAIFEAWATEESAASTWDDVCQRAKDGYPHAIKWHRMAISEARAAIEAMRKPNEDMYEAAWNAEVSCSYTESAYAWSAMIDAALNEKPRT